MPWPRGCEPTSTQCEEGVPFYPLSELDAAR